jgi:LPXTG-motif cell wall-anchored protein
VAGISAAAVCAAAAMVAVVAPSPASAANSPDVHTLFAADAVPATPAFNDLAAVEVGVKFAPTVDGTILGIRFYQGPGNTGSHTGHLWTYIGQSLGTVTFADSSDTGWQTAYFNAPVPVTAGTTYVASYFAPNGHYAADPDFFAKPLANGPLTAPTKDNGVYRYGSAGGAPTSTYHQTNYWVDVLFKSTEESTAPSASASASASTSASASASASAPAPSTSHSAPAPAPSPSAGGTGGGGSLPVTGSNAGLIAGAGLLLAGIGAVLFVVYRRRSVKFTA